MHIQKANTNASSYAQVISGDFVWRVQLEDRWFLKQFLAIMCLDRGILLYYRATAESDRARLSLPLLSLSDSSQRKADGLKDMLYFVKEQAGDGLATHCVTENEQG